jgi:hypothetical protein
MTRCLLLKTLPNSAHNKAIDALKDSDEGAADKISDMLPWDDKEKAAIKAAIKALLEWRKGKKFEMLDSLPRGPDWRPVPQFPRVPGATIFKLPPTRI